MKGVFMAGVLLHHNLATITPAANPKSLWQIRTAANRRTVLHAIELEGLGATPAAAAMELALVLQSADGTYDIDDSASILKQVPAFAGSISATVHITCSVEPGTNTVYYPISLHQQARLRWTPPTVDGKLILDSSTRWALRNIGAILQPLKAKFVFEE
jgi:hypothetical protein